MIHPSPLENLVAFAIAFLAGAVWSALVRHFSKCTHPTETRCPVA